MFPRINIIFTTTLNQHDNTFEEMANSVKRTTIYTQLNVWERYGNKFKRNTIKVRIHIGHSQRWICARVHNHKIRT